VDPLNWPKLWRSGSRAQRARTRRCSYDALCRPHLRRPSLSPRRSTTQLATTVHQTERQEASARRRSFSSSRGCLGERETWCPRGPTRRSKRHPTRRHGESRLLCHSVDLRRVDKAGSRNGTCNQFLAGADVHRERPSSATAHQVQLVVLQHACVPSVLDLAHWSSPWVQLLAGATTLCRRRASKLGSVPLGTAHVTDHSYALRAGGRAQVGDRDSSPAAGWPSA